MEHATEFATIIVTADATTHCQDGHTVLKTTLTTKSVNACLLDLTKFYGDNTLMQRASTLDVLAEMAKAKAPVLVYVTPANVQLMLPFDTWNQLVFAGAEGPSVLTAFNTLANTVTRIHEDMEKHQGGVCPLLCIDLEAYINPPAPAAAQDDDSTSGLAQAILDKSDIENVS